MKILKVECRFVLETEVETDEFTYYRRSPNNWTFQIGESIETVSFPEKLEAAYQEFMSKVYVQEPKLLSLLRKLVLIYEGKESFANQGQTLDGYSKLANYEAVTKEIVGLLQKGEIYGGQQG